MDTADLIAIDTHTHLEVSCRNPFDNYGEEYDRAADKYFRSSKRPTMDETIAFYREQKIGFVNFTVDAETQMGRRRIPNEEIAEAAQKNSDIMIAFGSIDPHKGKMGGREARKLVEEYGVKGFKFHPTVQGFDVTDRMAWPIYEVIAEYKLPAVFHSGHSGIGSGMRCGGGLRLQNSNPMLLEDVAIAFPDMQIVVAHPSWPWQDEAISLAMHKPNIWIDLSGWSPKYFPPQLVQYANTLLKDRILFGSDFPLITPDRWLKDFEEAGFKDAVKPLILKQNAMRLLGLDAAPLRRRPRRRRSGLDGQLVLDRLDAVDALRDRDCLVGIAGLVGRAVQRHDAVLGVDVDRQALDVGVGEELVFTLPVMAASPTASPALLIALSVAAIALEAAVGRRDGGRRRGGRVDPGAVSVVVVCFSHATRSAAAARTDRAASWVRCAFTRSPRAIRSVADRNRRMRAAKASDAGHAIGRRGRGTRSDARRFSPTASAAAAASSHAIADGPAGRTRRARAAPG